MNIAQLIPCDVQISQMWHILYTTNCISSIND